MKTQRHDPNAFPDVFVSDSVQPGNVGIIRAWGTMNVIPTCTMAGAQTEQLASLEA